MSNKEIQGYRHWQGLEAASCFGYVGGSELELQLSVGRADCTRQKHVGLKSTGSLHFPNTCFCISFCFPCTVNSTIHAVQLAIVAKSQFKSLKKNQLT